MIENTDLSVLVEPTLTWYEANKRDLPWRKDKDPYHIWVSEIMFQQTRVEAVIPYYERFMTALPTIEALAKCQEDPLLKLWEGSGYYNRVRNMQKAAQTICAEYGGQMPQTYDGIVALSGIGPYTAGAIASIAFDERVPAVDGNVLRILSRVSQDDSDILKDATKKRMTAQLSQIMPKEAGAFNQALMDLGSSICIPNGEPFCENCPWEAVCQAHKYGRETDFPVKAKKKKRKIEKKAVFLIEVSDKIILHKRPEKGLLSGLWELPNLDGELSAKELSEQMKKWEIGDYMIEPLGEGKHIFSHVEWQMRGYRIQMRDISEKLLEKEEWIAVSREDLEEKYAIPSAFECCRKQIYRG